MNRDIQLADNNTIAGLLGDNNNDLILGDRFNLLSTNSSFVNSNYDLTPEETQALEFIENSNTPIVFAASLSLKNSEPELVEITDVTGSQFIAFVGKPNFIDSSWKVVDRFSHVVTAIDPLSGDNTDFTDDSFSSQLVDFLAISGEGFLPDDLFPKLPEPVIELGTIDKIASGSKSTITWTDNLDEDVSLELYKGDSFYLNIVDSTASDGSYEWDVPAYMTEDSDYKIKIASVENSNVNDLSDDYFKIYTPSINIKSPDYLSKLRPGEDINITWIDNLDEDVQLDLYDVNNSFVQTIDSSTPSDGEYDWTIPKDLTTDSSYGIKISSVNNTNINQTSFFSIFEPKVELRRLQGDFYQTIGSSLNLKWYENLNENVRLDLYKGDEFVEKIYVSNPASDSDFSYSWTIPRDLVEGSDYRIKVSSTDDSEINDFSDGYFNIYRETPKIDFLFPYPNTELRIVPGADLKIVWQDNIGENVSLDLYEGFSLLQTIDSSTPSDGEYTWSVPADLADSTLYKINIKSVDNGLINASTDYIYTPDITVEDLNVNNKLNNNQLDVGESYFIRWRNNAIHDENVSLDLYKDGDYVQNIVSSTPSGEGRYRSAFYRWTVPNDLAAGSDYQIKVSSVDYNSISDFTDNSFTVRVPEIEVTNPNEDNVIEPGENFKITWNDDLDVLEKLNIELYKSDSLVTTIVSNTFSDGEYTWRVPKDLSPSSDYKIRIYSAKNERVSDFSDRSFSVDPTILVEDTFGDFFKVGRRNRITWESNLDENVRLDLYEGDEFASNIANSQPSSGVYWWDIPLDIATSSDYKIKVSSVDDNSISSFNKNNFTIYQPKITVFNPDGGNTLEPNAIYQISWEDNIGENVRLDLYKGNVYDRTIASSLSSGGVDTVDSIGSYRWLVPADIAGDSDYQVKITSLEDSNINDFSDRNFTIYQPNITVNDLNGGERLKVGEKYQITWDDNINENVNLYLYQGNTYTRNIASSIPSDGSYEWTVPENIADGNYRIKVGSVNDFALGDFTNNFTIYQPKITVNNPSGGNSLESGKNYEITWDDNISENVRIELHKGGSLSQTIAASTSSDGEYKWTPPVDIADGADYQVKIFSIDDDSVNDSSNSNFGIYQPNITVNNPNGADSLEPGNNFEIDWDDNISENVRLELYKLDSLVRVIDASTPSDGKYDWTIPIDLAAGLDYKIKISSVNRDSINDISDGSFSIEPEINFNSPENTAILDSQESLEITWNDNISENVKIDLYKGASLSQTIVPSTPSDGKYEWALPKDIAEGTDYKFKISSVDDSNINDTNEGFLQIYKASDIGIRVAREQVDAGVNHIIYLTNKISGRSRIDIYQGDNFVKNVFNYGSFADNNIFGWKVPTDVASGSNYRLKITDANNENLSEFSQSFKLFRPEIKVTYPNIGNIITSDKEVYIRWSDNLTEGSGSDGTEEVLVELYEGINDRTPREIARTSSTDGGGFYLWDVPDYLSGNEFRIKVTSLNYVLDRKNVSDFSDGLFSIREDMCKKFPGTSFCDRR